MPNKICERGVSLVEVMIALVVLLIVFMGLVQASLVTIQSNMINVIRDEAVQVTSERMTVLKSLPFDDPRLSETGLIDDDDENNINYTDRTLRNAPVQFTFQKIIEDDANIKRIQLITTWDWQGVQYTHSISSLLRER
jgi:prepilin-type N-terminal cleavage/methylation domain-containing protein